LLNNSPGSNIARRDGATLDARELARAVTEWQH